MEVKIAETSLAVLDGASEIDIVFPVGKLLEEKYDDIVDEIREIKSACREARLKVILESGLLSMKQLRIASILAMAHYYQDSSIQEIADFIGDSLALAQQAAKTTADIIVLCGVHFMGETAKLISPEKKVLIPDANAGCSLADSCSADAFEQFVKAHPDHTVISYVNTTAAVKALTDISVTSTNAVAIVQSLPKDEKIIFGPDRNLGNYINSLTGRNMLLWDGACHVHEQFSIERIFRLKEQYLNAKIIAHPECKSAVLALADFIGSTASLLRYAQRSDFSEFIVATESGILHAAQNANDRFLPLLFKGLIVMDT